MDVPLWAWLTVLAIIVVMLVIDLVAHREAHVIGFSEAAKWSVFWVTSGLIFGGVIWAIYGAEIGQQYYAGFLIEKSLSVDNVFVWAIIFAALGVPPKYQHRVLFLGVVGALVFRGIFIALGAALIENFGWILYFFAALLIWTAISMVRHRNDHGDPRNNRVYRWFTKVVPTSNTFYGQKFLVRTGVAGAIVATPLLATLVLVELTDIMFAIDSIPAIFAITTEPFIVFTANAFALLGLRALYFLLADLVHRFVYLKLGLAGVLLWVGIKMALHDVVKVDTTISLAVIVVILTIAIVASLYKTRGQAAHHVTVPNAAHFSEATEAELAEARSVWTRRSLASVSRDG